VIAKPNLERHNVDTRNSNCQTLRDLGAHKSRERLITLDTPGRGRIEKE
jgi:hypothetical protein